MYFSSCPYLFIRGASRRLCCGGKFSHVVATIKAGRKIDRQQSLKAGETVSVSDPSTEKSLRVCVHECVCVCVCVCVSNGDTVCQERGPHD